MSQIKSSYDITAGVDDLFTSSTNLPIVQPLQMIPSKLKTDKWCRQNIDYIEFEGLRQVEANARRLLKCCELAAGEIDREDYFGKFDPEVADAMEMIIDEENPLPDAMSLQFYPLIPSYYETLKNEYSLRGTSKVDYRAVDQTSISEILQKKESEILNRLMSYGQQKMMEQLLEAGYELNDPAVAEQMQPENLKESLPAIQNFYDKGFRTTYEIWAEKMHKLDVNRFRMDELEVDSFANYLRMNKSYWYLNYKKDDYTVELLNPILTFHKHSPKNPWASSAKSAGFFDILTIADAIDEDGEFLSEEDMRNLESLLPGNVDANYRSLDDVSIGSKWDASKSYEDNRKYGVDMRKTLAAIDISDTTYDIVDYVLGKNKNLELIHDTGLIRRATVFWKTQRKIGLVYEILETGDVKTYRVDENWVQQITPIYNTKFQDLRDATTLIYGQHVDWTYVNEVWGAKKYTGSNPTFSSINEDGSEDAIYIGVGTKKPGRIPFQGKGSLSPYDVALPIEGRDFADENTPSKSMVELLIPPQILFNIVNNQIIEIVSDEPGRVLALDQGSIPKHSFDGSWGTNNYVKSRGVMGEFNLLLLDNSIANTESPTQTNHTQVLDLSQSGKLLSRMQLSRYAKEMAADIIGFSPQRASQQSGMTSNSGITAEEITQNQTGSYNRTESYFENHSDRLMPRVHEMRTNAAQYYCSKKSSFVLNLMITPEERSLLEFTGTDLMAKDFQIFCNNSSKNKLMLKNIQDWVMRTNTNGAGLLDMEVLQVDSLTQMNLALKKIEERNKAAAEEDHKRKLEILEAEAKNEQAAIDKQNNFEALQNMLDRQARLLGDKIKASGYAAMQDLNQNNQSDQMDIFNKMQEEQSYQRAMNLDNKKVALDEKIAQNEYDIENRKIDADLIKSANNLTTARVNKNKYDK